MTERVDQPSSSAPLEIERTYLLSAMPPLPAGHRAVRIEQGYLPDPAPGAQEVVEGRLRRKVDAEGRVTCFHTVKRGEGLVRTEVERAIDEAELARLWPATAGRRLSKTRYLVSEGSLTWEIDRFDGWALVLAEVELPSVDAEAPLPAWLLPYVVRDVTEDPAYRNYQLALRLGRGEGPP